MILAKIEIFRAYEYAFLVVMMNVTHTDYLLDSLKRYR